VPILVALVILAALGLAALLWGVDSRDPAIDRDFPRPTNPYR
jgi:hypothetical protein